MREYLLAVGGVLGSIAASTCCIVPLALVSVGVSGAWIGSLTALAAYQPLFIAIAVSCLATGFWLVFWRSAKECETEACVSPRTARLLKSALWVKCVLWLGAALVAMSVGVDFAGRLTL